MVKGSVDASRIRAELETHLVDVLALELRDQLLQPGLIGLNTTSGEERLDVSGGWGGVTTEREEEIRGDVLHFVSEKEKEKEKEKESFRKR
jgi:hypothetical protein